jgi:hypothetical protein
MSQFELHSSCIKNLETLSHSGRQASDELVKLVKEFIEITPIDFGIISNGGFRTAEEQNVLYRAGNSECDGYGSKSRHQLGLAVDLIPYVNGVYTWEVKHAFKLSGAFEVFCTMKGFELTVGSDWNKDGDVSDGWDPCHFETEE